ncbi:hypothetical protein V565_248950 [Rhizoctonia solani 123E]|uniref:Uncharacterized protein n=1 Tax=Rhizoctonia solani 123E TaxID=1423351 RepID=A0A074RLV3_9AGAM|nr:hypothetical protein V565_248950 [Rhizoctonia solani 123E]
MNDWNWRKLTTMVTHIIGHLPEAVKMATELEELWLIVDGSVSKTLTTSWSGMWL